MVYGPAGRGATTRNLPTVAAERERFCISDPEVLQLAEYALTIEDHYSERAGESRPMDIEWAKDGVDGELYIVQARPETVSSQSRPNTIEDYRLTGTGRVRVTGRSVGAKIASGRVRVLLHSDQLEAFQPGEVLVADNTTPDWQPILKRAAAVVTNRGGRTCHAAIVARELGIPAVIGTEDATALLQSGEQVTVSCAEGDIGRVYDGQIPFEIERADLEDLPQPQTRMMINLGNPELAFKTSFLPNDGVGLARMEFIVNEAIKMHPMALVHPERIEDAEERRQIETLTRLHHRPTDFFVERLSEGVGTIAAAFYPKPVIVRLSDFKTNEYASLLGGRAFEPHEANPMIGFRGASRYAHPAYAEGFALECAAMRRVREDMGFTNVKLMIPFCRRVEEAERVLDAMAEHGLRRGERGLEIYVMCEVPNNVVQIDAFARLFDGFSIGSNDLTQLVLGVDRDSEIVAFDFDERDPGVVEMIRLAVEGCRRNERHSGICGQAPSDYPEFAQALVRMGIDSISLNPDSVLETTRRVLEIERELGLQSRPG
jgi:pyruvate,water dikinase